MSGSLNKPGTPFHEMSTRIILRTACGSERTFLHPCRGSLPTTWATPLYFRRPMAEIAQDGEPTPQPPRARYFKLLSGGPSEDDWVYAEMP